MLYHLFTLLTLTLLVDTLPRLENLKIYNQVGNIKIERADTFFIQIHTYPGNTNSFSITRKLKKNTLYVESRARKSCTDCGVDIIIGAPNLGYAGIEITSGNLLVEGTIGKISASISSGDITLKGIFNNIDLESLDGNIRCIDSKIDTLNVSLLRGSITIKTDEIVKSGKINVLSGDVKLYGNKYQGFRTILTERGDTISRDGEGNLLIKITSGTFKGI